MKHYLLYRSCEKASSTVECNECDRYLSDNTRWRESKENLEAVRKKIAPFVSEVIEWMKKYNLNR